MENTTTSHIQNNVSVVAFKLNQRTFALPLDVIVQILPMMTITPIPHLSKIVKGTVNIRGEDVLVVNLRTHFDMEEADLQLYTPLLLLKLKDRLLALIVDAVLDVMNLPQETLTNLQTMMPDGVESIPLLKGVSHYNNDSILVLDPDHLFYNQHALAQHLTELRTSVPPNTPDTNTPVEDTLVPLSADVSAAKPVAKKTIGAKRTSAAASAEPLAPLVSNPPAMENG